MLNAADLFVYILPNQSFRFLFGLLAVKPKSKGNKYILVLCSSQIKLFKQGRQDLRSRSGLVISLTIIAVLESGFTIFEKPLAFYRIFKSFFDQKVSSSLISGSEGRITLEIFLLGTSSSSAVLPKLERYLSYFFSHVCANVFRFDIEIIKPINIEYTIKIHANSRDIL